MMRTAVFACLILTPLAGSAAAQVTGPTPSNPAPSKPAPSKPEAAPKAPLQLVQPDWQQERSRRLDTLFGRLAKTEDEAAARLIERQIGGLLGQSGSDTADLLAARATAAYVAEESDLAIHLLDSVTTLVPTYAEAWYRRATIRFSRKEHLLAAADLEEALRLEPRHYLAYAGLGLILSDIGNKKGALAAYRKALEINPQMEKIGPLAKELEEELRGRDI